MSATVQPQTFQEFLQELAGEQNGPAARAHRREWLDAIERLLTQIEGWVKEADPDGVLELRRTSLPRYEHGLGRFYAPGLEIAVGDVRVEVAPAARNTRLVRLRQLKLSDLAAALSPTPRYQLPAGRVEITNRVIRYSLYRFLPADSEPDTDEVWVLDEPPPGVPWRQATPFDRNQLELILKDLLS